MPDLCFLEPPSPGYAMVLDCWRTINTIFFPQMNLTFVLGQTEQAEVGQSQGFAFCTGQNRQCLSWDPDSNPLLPGARGSEDKQTRTPALCQQTWVQILPLPRGTPG